jgi:hypothetical protein
VFWAGDDPDGRVDHFEYAIDPGPKDTVWVNTPRSEEVLFFSSTTPEGIKGDPVPKARDYHVLVLRAVDNQGAMSPFKTRAFYSYTVAPSVEIVEPHPNEFIEEKVPPTLTVTGRHRSDGQINTRPVRYLFRLMPFDPIHDGWKLGDPRLALPHGEERRLRPAGTPPAGTPCSRGSRTSRRTLTTCS